MLYIILTWIIIDTFSEIISQFLAFFSGNIEYIEVSASVILFVEKFIVIACLVLYHLIVNVLIRKKVSYYFYPYQWVIIFLFFFGIVMIVPTLESIAMGKEVNTNEYVVMCICAMLMLFLFIIIMIWQSYVLRKNMSMKEREISYQYMLRSQSEYFDSLMKNDSEMRKLRHDMRAHITALKELISQNDNEKLLEYLSRMEEKTNLTKTIRYTGNNAVDAVINELTRQMDENGIEFKFDGIISVREEIKDFDLCTIFYNILMNAIEGCMAVEGADKKTISVKVKNIGDKLGISIENETILEKIPETGILVTTKEDKVNHGFGTMNVKEVVSKYDGIYDNSIKGGKFIADIII
ncbi:MAG: sensor histidine kinase [Eubacterium sp.]|nr:sensor histidine kinase [Eubacterium sp.]